MFSHSLSQHETKFFDGYVGRSVHPQIAGSHKITGMPSRCLLCPEMAIYQLDSPVRRQKHFQSAL